LTYRVLLTEPIDRVGLELLAPDAEVIIAPEPKLPALLDLAPDVDAFIVRAGPCPRQLILAAPRLQVIGKHGVGVDNIDIPAASERGVPVFSTPGTNAEAVVEMALAMMLSLARRLRPAQQVVEGDDYVRGRATYLAVEMQGKTLGLIGLGRIGSLLAQKCAAAFAMPVVAYDPYVKQAPTVPGADIQLVSSLDALLAQADFISIHVPLTPETRGLIGREQLAKMKQTAYLVNTARGAVVDEAALAEALRNNVIAGAGIDVFAQEPTPAEHPLFGLDNAILTPHVGGQTAESMQKMARAVAEGVLAALHGQRPANVLNPEVYTAR
jgi:D-3-phosphoglycerate dehydrogenase / 2-oxoglutarate reductase